MIVTCPKCEHTHELTANGISADTWELMGRGPQEGDHVECEMCEALFVIVPDGLQEVDRA